MPLSPDDARRLGGSDIAALVGLSPWATPLTVYARIVTGEGTPDSPALRRGRLMEPVVREMYRLDEGVELLGPTSLRHPEKDWLRASLDDVGRRPGRGRHAVEFKTGNQRDADKWGPLGSDELPEQYLCQTSWYLGTGLAVGALDEPVADVAVLLLGVEETPRVYRVEHDAEVYAWLLEAAERFWRDFVVPRRPPPPSNPAREVESVRRLYKRETEPLAPFADLAPEDKSTVLAYAEARRQQKAAEAALADAEVRLKLALGWRAGVDALPPDTGLKRLKWTAAEQGRTEWKAVAEALAKENGVSRETVLSLASQHRGEPPRALRATEVKEET